MALLNLPSQDKTVSTNSYATPVGTPLSLQGIQNQAMKIVNPVKGMIKNFQTTLADQYAKDTNPPAPVGKLPVAENKPIGVSAKAPEQNIKPATNTIAPTQVKTTLPQQANAVKAATTSKMATLYGPNGQKKAVTVGSKEASDLQGQGWGLTAGSYKAPVAKPATTLQGLASTTAKPQPTNVSGLPVSSDITSKGLIGNLNAVSQAGSPLAGAAQSNLMNVSANNPATSGPALQAYNKAVSDLAAFDQQYAQRKAELSSSPISLEFKQGREQVLDQEYSQQRAALQNAVNQQQAAIGQQIQGVQTQQSGFGTAGNLAQTGQTLEQSGIATAAGLAQPIQLPYGTPLVSPQTGTQIGGTGGGVQPSDPFYQTMQQYAQLLASNQGSAVPATITGNPVLNAQLIGMAKALNPNYNVNVSTGAAGAQQQAAGTQAGQIQAYQSALQQGQNLQNQLSDLLNQFGLNPSDINKVNEGLQVIAKNTSDPRYSILQNYVNDIANTYSQILTPAGGTQTDTTRSIATSMLDSSMRGTGIMDVMKSLDSAAQAKIAGVSTSGGLGGGVGGTATGSTVSAGGFNFTKDANGNWVVAK